MHVYINLPAKIGVAFWMVYALVCYILFAANVISSDIFTIAFVLGTVLIFLFIAIMIGWEYQAGLIRKTREFRDVSGHVLGLREVQNWLEQMKTKVRKEGKDREAFGKLVEMVHKVSQAGEKLADHQRELGRQTETHRIAEFSRQFGR